MQVLERDVEASLRRMVERNRGLCLKWTCPGWLGVPDRIVLLPGGHVFFVELKRPSGGKRAAMQEWWAKKLQALGFTHFWVLDREDVGRLEQVLRVWLREDGCNV